jgi:hypothetical protein
MNETEERKAFDKAMEAAGYSHSYGARHQVFTGWRLARTALERSEHPELQRLRDLAGTCYAGLGSEHDLPEQWLDVLLAASNGEPFTTEGLLPYRAEHPVGSALTDGAYQRWEVYANRAGFIDDKGVVLEGQASSAQSSWFTWEACEKALAATPSRAPAEVSDEQIDAMNQAAQDQAISTGTPPHRALVRAVLALRAPASVQDDKPAKQFRIKNIGGAFDEWEEIPATPNAAPAAVSDEQIAAMLWSDEFVSYHSTHDPIIQTTSSRMVAFARAILALSSPPSVGEPTPDPLQGAADWLKSALAGCSTGELQWRLCIGYNRASRLFEGAALAAAQPPVDGHGAQKLRTCWYTSPHRGLCTKCGQTHEGVIDDSGVEQPSIFAALSASRGGAAGQEDAS